MNCKMGQQEYTDVNAYVVQHSSGQAESEKEREGTPRMKSSSPGGMSTGSIRQQRMAPRHVTIKNSIQRLLMPVAMREQFLEEGAPPEEDITSLGSQVLIR